MAYTTEQYNALKDAISTGANSVNYGDKSVTYNSLDDMLRVLKLMEVELGIVKVPVSRKYACFDKGI